MRSYQKRIFHVLIAGILLIMLSVSAPGGTDGDIEVWSLDLANESGEVSVKDFPAWMESKGFEPFSYLWFKRRPEYWRIGPCEGTSESCLVLQEHDSSSHIIYPFEPALTVADTLAVELAYLVKLQAKGASLDQKDKEDAPLRIFLTFQTNDGLLHLALTDSAAHAAGTVVKSARKPDSIRYYMLPDRQGVGKYELSSFPVKTIFQKVYGPRNPGVLVAIGIKSDSNNLGGESLTYLKTLRLIR
jgi:hypothetical protein